MVALPFTPPEEFDDYVIVRPLGVGRMGQVYLAEDSVLARAVAIKFIAGVPDLTARRRFLLEARATARIQHPNVVTVYRVGEVADRPYLVSELVRGHALDELPRPRPWLEVLTLGVELARGLAAAHRRGVVHCDVKPQNVMVGDDGVPKLVDFGLARVVQDRDATRSGLVGTPDYMAPEVWAGDDPTRRADVYSLGVVLYELCCGTTPFAEVAPAELAAAVVGREAPSLRERAPATDARLVAIIERCLNRDPEERYPSAEELRDALELLVRHRDAVGVPTGNPYRGLRPFEASHRAMFFGRSLEIGAIVERLRTEAMVIVAGDSGVGKSSLVRAGVIPAILEREAGFVGVTIVPGARPLTTLATALDSPGLVDALVDDPAELARTLRRVAGAGGLLLFIDQLEELVTLGDPGEVAALAAGLARLDGGVPGVRVIATARADFLSRLAALPQLGPELARLLYFVAPLPAERLREVIVGPAQAAGVRFESDAMVARLVESTAAAGSGGLPLLSFALAALWEERDVSAGVIGEVALAAVGGVDGALARHADAVLSALPPSGRAVARRILARLVTTVGTRARRRADELVLDDAGRTVLEALVRGRLLVIHDAAGDALYYELAHEVLVTGWATLREWLELDGEQRAQRERLGAAASEWHRLGRRSEATWRGRQLASARELDRTTLTPRERDFVRASIRADRRRRWSMRVIVLGALAVVAGGYVVQRGLAQRRVDRAVAVELRAAVAARTVADAALVVARTESLDAFAAFDRGDPIAGESAWQRVLAARLEADRELRAVAARLEAALARDPGRTDVRGRLGDALYDRAVLAEQTQTLALRDELVSRLPANDPGGQRLARWRALGELAVTTPPGTRVTVEPGAHVVPASGGVALAPGSYVVTATSAAGDVERDPVVITRGASSALALDPPPASTIPPGFVFIPAGTTAFGIAGNDDARRNFFKTAPQHERAVAAFLVGRDEVTVGEWLGFVESQPVARRDELLPAADAKVGASGGLAVTRDARGWRYMIEAGQARYEAGWGEPISYRGRAEHARQDWRRFPVTGITAIAAEEYAAWLASTGAVPGARLCTELEWERAARGVDGRNYPRGDQLDVEDANIDTAHGHDHVGPDEVGSHPQGASVFGLNDMSGNAFEWTQASPGTEYVIRGGSFAHDRVTAHLGNRNVSYARMRDSTLGLRLCATPMEKHP